MLLLYKYLRLSMHVPAWSYLHRMMHSEYKCRLSDIFWSLFLFDSGSPVCTLERLPLRIRYFLYPLSWQLHIQNHFWQIQVGGCILLFRRLLSASFLSLHSGLSLLLRSQDLRLPDMRSDFRLPTQHTAVHPVLWPVLSSRHLRRYTDKGCHLPLCTAYPFSHRNMTSLRVHFLPVHMIYLWK